MAVWVAATTMSVGCGGRLARPSATSDASVATDADTDTPDGTGACPTSVTPGGLCDVSSVVCLSDDGCNGCVCLGGSWVCDTRVCAMDAGSCPPVRPRTGGGCGTATMTCEYGAGCDGAHCVCAGGRWTCDPLVCVDS